MTMFALAIKHKQKNPCLKMELFNTYSESLYVKYKSNTCSKATLFNIFAVLLTIIPPYLIAFRTQGFWVRLETVREKPKVQFKHEILIILETQQTDGRSDTLTWTNLPGLHSMIPEKANPFILSSEGPTNVDGTKGFLDVEIAIPLLKKEKVYGVHLLLLFSYEFSRYANMEMESMAYLTYISGKNANLLDVFADLRLVQKQPLWNRVRDTRFNYPVIPRNSKIAKDYSLRRIFGNYINRNVSTTLMNKYELWMEDRTIINEFIIRGRINYVEESYECWSTLWNTLKWAWIQYFSIFVIVTILVRKLMHAVYGARIFETIREDPKNENKHYYSRYF